MSKEMEKQLKTFHDGRHAEVRQGKTEYLHNV